MYLGERVWHDWDVDHPSHLRDATCWAQESLNLRILETTKTVESVVRKY